MKVKKMSANSAPSSKKSRFPVSSLLPRIAIYSAVVAGTMASFDDFKLNTLFISSGKESLQAKQIIARINRGQQAYYGANGRFNNDLTKFAMGVPEQIDDYNYTIVSSMGPVQTLHNHREPAQFESAIAIAKPNDMTTGKSYTGAVFAFKEKSMKVKKIITAICESDRINASYAETWNPPTFDGKEIHCQPGTTMVKVRP